MEVEFKEEERRARFILIRVSVPGAAMLMCMCVREDGIISLMVLTHLVLSHDLLVGLCHDYCGATNCEVQCMCLCCWSHMATLATQTR